MKNVVLSVCCMLFLLVAGSVNAQENIKNFDVSVGFQTYYHDYKEPGIMENKGFFYGLSYSILHEERNLLLGLEGLLAYGEVDYSSTSTGELDGVDDICTDTRFILGYSILNDKNTRVTPFVGIAYRFLQDDKKYMRTTTNSIGYLRESNYLYSPVGLKIKIQYAGGWSLSPELEYDLFWFGQQESELGYIAGRENMANDQCDGYGYRLSLTLAKKTVQMGYSFQMFYRYWDIDTSDIDIDRYGNIGFEPANETSEYGLNFSILF